MATENLPNGCSRERAEAALAKYDMRRQGGYKNIAERDAVRFATGMTVTQLRKWLKETA